LNFTGHIGRYCGVDVCDALLEEARILYPRCSFVKADIFEDSMSQHDYVVLSGLFNANFGQDTDWAYSFIKKCFDLCKVAFVFNAISTKVNFKDVDFFYLDPAETFNYAVGHLSPVVEIRHGFLPYNYTCAIYKGYNWDSLNSGGVPCS
jgi:hypothetical protein